MRLALCCLAALAPLHAATLNGVVLDHETGRPVARTIVVLQGVQTGAAAPSAQSTHTNARGSFSFGGLNMGSYLLSASRVGYATQHFGQKRWNLPGTTIAIERDDAYFVEVRMHHPGGVAGTVFDQNQIGIADVPVAIYSAEKPIKLIQHVVTDERGVYRIGGLDPGEYFVRTGARRLDGDPSDEWTSLLPSYYKDGTTVDGAHPVKVELDRTEPDVNIHPVPGRLYRVTGRVIPAASAAVTLISDDGRVAGSTGSGGGFSFENVAPGLHEIEAGQGEHIVGYARLVVDNDKEDIVVNTQDSRPVNVEIEERQNNRVDRNTVTLFARRKSLDGEGSVIRVIPNRTELGAGVWEISVNTLPNYYPVSVSSRSYPSQGKRADDWNEIRTGPGPGSIRVVLSSHPASVRGRVTAALNEPAAGAPVFLETMDLERTQIRATRADEKGLYQFLGLSPGRYRIVASYDFDSSGKHFMEAASAPELSLMESAAAVQDLGLFALQ